MEREVGHSPLPWRQDRSFYCEIEDANGDHIFTASSQYNRALGDPRSRANAEFILEAVNGREKLLRELEEANGLVAALKEEREKMIADMDAHSRETIDAIQKTMVLKGLLRRTVPYIESCIGHLRNDRATSLGDPKTMMAYTLTIEDIAVLLDEVRHALGGKGAAHADA